MINLIYFIVGCLLSSLITSYICNRRFQKQLADMKDYILATLYGD